MLLLLWIHIAFQHINTHPHTHTRPRSPVRYLIALFGMRRFFHEPLFIFFRLSFVFFFLSFLIIFIMCSRTYLKWTKNYILCYRAEKSSLWISRYEMAKVIDVGTAWTLKCIAYFQLNEIATKWTQNWIEQKKRKKCKHCKTFREYLIDVVD